MRLTLKPLTKILLLPDPRGRHGLLYQRLFWGALTGGLAALLLGDSPYLESLELTMLKWRYQAAHKLSSWQEVPPASKDISIVGFDDSSQFELSIARFNDQRSQAILAEALNVIERGHPTLIAIDLDLRGAANADLIKSIRRHRNVVLSLFGSLEGGSDLPAAELLSHAASYGYGQLTTESNGEVYRLPVNFQQLATPGDNEYAPVKSLTEAILDLHRRIKGVGPPSGSMIASPDQPVYINFRQLKYPHVAFQELLSPEFPVDQFRDRIVIIGSTLTSRRDDPQHLKTPLNPSQSEVEVQADAVSTLLDSQSIFSLSPDISKSLLLIFGAICGAGLSILPVLSRTFIALSGVGILLVFAQLCFQLLHLAVPVVPPLAVLISSFILGTVIYLDTDLRLRNRELAEARQDMQERAEKERQRIAEDLHDETLPALSAVARLADRLTSELVDNPVPGQMREKLDSAVSEMRRVINDLHPSVLETMGFVPALENLLNAQCQESGIEGKFLSANHDSAWQLPMFTQLQLYRIVQEGLNNVQKHSQASLVELRLGHGQQELSISVTDNGRGFNPKETKTKSKMESHGLVNIKQRAQLIGAQALWRTPKSFSSGTELIIFIPLERDQEKE